MTHPIHSSADLLDAAADEIETHGWCRGFVLNNDGQMCLTGALRKAAFGSAVSMYILHNRMLELSGHPYFATAMDALTNYLIRISHTRTSIVGWNDSICANDLEAIELLRQVAKECRANGDY